jgi:TP901 family phage tail tape measure protein
MASLAELMVRVGADISEFTRNMNNVQSTMSSTGKNLMSIGSSVSDVGQKMTVAVTAPIAGLIGSAVLIGANFDSQMSRVQAISGATANQFEQLRQKAIDLGASTTFSSTEVGQAMENLASAGFDTNQIIEATAGVLNLASSAGIGLSEASDIASSAINGFGLKASDASHVADVLAKASAVSATNATGLGEAFKYVAPVAKGLGLSIEETASAIGLMANAGIDGSTAGTTLRAGLLRLASPTKQMTDLMKATGSQFFDSSGKMKNMAGIIDTLKKATKGMTDEQKTNYLATLFGSDAVSGFMVLIDAGSAKLNEYTNQLKKSDGSAQEMANTMNNNLAGAWQNLTGALESLAISFSDVMKGGLQYLAGKIADFVTWLNSLSPTVKKVILVMALLVASIGPLLMVIGFVIQTIGMLTISVGALDVALLPIIATVGLVVLAIVAFIAIFVTAYNKIDWFRKQVNFAFQWIYNEVSQAISAVVSYFSQKVAELKTVWDREGGGIRDAIKAVWDTIVKIITVVMPQIVNIIRQNWDDIKAYFDVVFKAIGDAIRFWSAIFQGDWGKAWEMVKSLFKDAIDGILKLAQTSFFDELIDLAVKGLLALKNSFMQKFDEIKTTITTKLGDWWNAMVLWFQSIPSKIATQIDTWKTAIHTWFENEKTEITNKLNDWWTAMLLWFKSIPSKITTQLTEWGTAIKTWTDQQNEENKRQFGLWWTDIQNWFKSIPQKISNELDGWKTSITTWFTNTKNDIVSKLEDWWTGISNWFTSIPSKISSKFTDWKNTITKWFDNTKSNIEDKLGDWWSTMSKWFESIPSKIGTQLEDWWNGMLKWFQSIPSKITSALEGWWTAIKSWFTSLPNKPEIKNAGSNMVDKLSDGNKAKKQDFMDKLGKIIVEVAEGALAFAVVALIATGRELIKRMIDGIGQKKSDLQAKAGELMSAFSSAISSKIGSIGSVGGKVADAFLSPIKKLKSDVDYWIGRIVGAFSSMHISIPKPKLPSIDVGIGHKSILGIDVPYPTFGVHWNAKGAFFDKATVLGGGQGVGEAGTEAVLPLSNKKYMAPFAKAVSDNLAQMNKGASQGNVENHFHFAEGAFVVREEADIEKIAQALYDKQKRTNRRNGL